MKTSDLIAALAAQPAPVARHALARRLAPALTAGVAASILLLVLMLGVRPLSIAVHTSPFWMKAGYTAALAAAALPLVLRLARPGGRTGPWPWVLTAPVAVILILGVRQMSLAAPADRAVAWLGHSWILCPWLILMLAAPIFAATAWAVRRLAPTRLTLAGAATGLLSGALSATVYGLFCQETSAAFVAVWYTLGMAICAAIGAMAGPRLLRW